LSGETLFISDLHLDQDRPAITGLFFQFLENTAPAADALYILGDLFEVWLGDDDDSVFNLSVMDAIRRLGGGGTPVYFMHGNRDFLIGSRFAEQTGITLLDEPLLIDLYGTTTLLMHGDSLCIDDHKYMAFRSKVRAREWQQTFLSQSLEERNRIVRDLREESREETAQKPLEILDVNPQEVEKTMLEYGVTQMIHGHTHRPAIHRLELNGKPATRIVLGDWGPQGSVLRCSQNGCALESFE
jgi:UDP-2,3-diacylglucosamine hydrolase